jgi:hypothetical protein
LAPTFHDTTADLFVMLPTVTAVGAAHAVRLTVSQPVHALGNKLGCSDRART